MPLNRLSKLTRGLRNRHFLIIDVFGLLLTPFLALFIRLDGNVDYSKYGIALVYATILFVIIKLVIFYVLNLYRSYWRTASIDELARLAFIGFNAILMQTLIFWILGSFEELPFGLLPKSLPIVEGLIAISFVTTSRFSIRILERLKERRIFFGDYYSYVIIIGAGAAGVQVVQELQRNSHLMMTPIAFLDDDPEKLHLKIRGIPVIGYINELPIIAKKNGIKKIIIAMPTAPGKKIREIVEDASKIGIGTLTVPSIYEILSGKVDISKIRKIEIEDLLRRKPVQTDDYQVIEFIKGKNVMLTGAGGSIGSELSRQILKKKPARLILIGHGENSIFEIEDELKFIKKKIGFINTKLYSRISDIKDIKRLENIFNEFKPDVIFHAAAHKHVPLMEENPSEAITNNLLGTRNLVDCAVKFKVNNFVLISTDKAVNSTNIMGVSKRIAEMIVLNAAKVYNADFKAVRFGNVLGSRGSVILTFKKQLERGGPLTVTDPDISRYFMTIPEAVQLVLQASVLGKGGEIFVLDMGEPVKIADLAKDVIRLAGFTEGVDIDISYTGLRPGEKMFEELFGDGEEYLRTSHKKIMFAKNSSSFIPPDLNIKLSALLENCYTLTKQDIIHKLKEIVPNFNHKEFR